MTRTTFRTGRPGLKAGAGRFMMGSGTSVVRGWLLVVIAGLLVCNSISASAQKQKPRRSRRETNASRQARIQRTVEDTYSHKYEVEGGGGYLRFRSGEFTQKNNEVAWHAAGNYYVDPKLAFVGDARGYFGNAKPLRDDNFNLQSPHPQINEYTFMGGASYRFLRHEKVALSVQGLGGVAWGIFSGGDKGLIASQSSGLWNDGFRPAFNIGISADYNVYPNLAVRITPNYLGTFFTSPSGGSVQNQIGFTAGVIYRFSRLHQ